MVAAAYLEGQDGDLIGAQDGGLGLGLTDLQLDYLILYARGLSRPAIAREMHVQPWTVHAHMQVIRKKLGIHNAAEAAQLIAHRRRERDRPKDLPALQQPRGVWADIRRAMKRQYVRGD